MTATPEALPNALFVAWQNPETGLILPVGRLLVDDKGAHARYEFAYVRHALSAQSQGFLPFVAFPELESVYRSDELFPLFANRVLRKNRPDYTEYVEQLGLRVDAAEPMTLLGRSNGRRTTDKIEVFAPPVLSAPGIVSVHFLVRGVRHLEGAEAAALTLKPGDDLVLEVDPKNPVNPRAVVLRGSANAPIGYVPDYLVNELFGEGKATTDSARVSVERVNPPPAPVHHRVLCQLTMAWDGSMPFSGEGYQPIAGNAAHLAA